MIPKLKADCRKAGYSREFLVGGVPPGSPNPGPISDQKNAIFQTRFQGS